ncbi:energy-coupling factor transporter transmembrane component T family protein [Agromyces sp. MMS24-K17]|uniref:energy-coupling factor transporter transmembrane component T family protein n=1 Tax=Agromyces sp. MMS24-K17 TaxID=3372850 RepID=UPI003754B412
MTAAETTAAEASVPDPAAASAPTRPAAPAPAPAPAPATIDPFAEQQAPAWRFLHGLNPLAKLFAPLPVMLVLVFTRGLAVPIVVIVLGVVLLLVGAHLRARAAALLVAGLPVAVALLGVSFGIWTDPERLAPSPADAVVLWSIGDWEFTLAMYLVGLATALRIAALLVLSLVAGLTSTGPELVRALVQNLRVPYRIGYTALAALRFVPRFGHELEVIRAAHRVRGTDHGRGPIAAVRRMLSTAIPLLASAIRHAERVALAMDARAFGAHPTRTERTISRWRVRDTVFVALFWATAAAVFWWGFASGSAWLAL